MSKSNRNGQMVKTIRRFLTINEAKSVGAYNIRKMTFPPDPWGTTVVLFSAIVKERVVHA